MHHESENSHEESENTVDAYAAVWTDLIIRSSIDAIVKEKLLGIIHSATAVVGKFNQGSAIDKIGERLATVGFIYELTGKANAGEVRALVGELDADIVRVHRELLDRKQA